MLISAKFKLILVNQVENLVEEQFPELERDQIVQDALHSLDFPAFITSIPLVEIATGWNLAVIPDHTPLLPLFSLSFREALTISEGVQSYQFNLFSRDELIPTYLQPRIVEGVSDGFANLSALANSSPAIQGVKLESPDTKARNFSSSSSSRASDVCFFSAEEDPSLTEDLFYDPMRMELLDAFYQDLETPVKLEDAGITKLEVQPEMQPLYGTHEISANETPLLYSENSELQNIVPLEEEIQSGTSEISSPLNRSSESLFMAETTTRSGSDQRPSVRFNENQEIILFGDEFSDGETSNGGSIVEEEILEESTAGDSKAFIQMENLKTATEQMEEDHPEAVLDLVQKSYELYETLQNLHVQREPLVDTGRAEENEILTEFQGVSTEAKILMLDDASSQISTALDESAAEPKFITVFNATVAEQNQHDEGAESSKIGTDIVPSTADLSLEETQEAGTHEVVSEVNENLEEEPVEENLVSIDVQNTLESQQVYAIPIVHREAEQTHEIPFESVEEFTVEPEISFDFIVTDEILRHFLMDNNDLRNQIKWNAGLLHAQGKIESQGQIGVLEDNLKSEQTDENEIKSAEEISSMVKPSSDMFVQTESAKSKTEADLQPFEEKIQGNLEPINKNDNLGSQSRSAAPNYYFGLENALEGLLESVEEIKDSPNVELPAGMESSKDQLLAGETESVSISEDSTKSRKASLLTDEKSQAGSSEKSSALDNGDDSAVSIGALEQIAVNEGDSLVADFSLSVKDVKDQKSDTVGRDAMSAGPLESQGPQYSHYPTEQSQEIIPEPLLEIVVKAELNIKLDVQREPMKEQIQIGDSEISTYYDRKIAAHEVNMVPEENQQAGASETSTALDTAYEVVSFADANLRAFINKTKIYGDVEATLAPSDLQPVSNDQTLLENQQIEFDEEIKGKKYEYFTELSTLNKADQHFGIEQSEEIELEGLEELSMKETFDEKLKSELTALTERGIIEGVNLIPQFNDNETPVVVERTKVGPSEILIYFSESNENILPSVYSDDGIISTIQTKELDMKSFKDEHIPVDDQVQLRWQPEVSATPESAITLATESPNTDDSKFNEDEIKSHLQLPISAKGIELESFEDLNITDDRVANLKLELHSVEYCLPLSDEFCAFVKNIDFEECVVEGRRQSIDDKVTTLPAEIVVFDDSKLELDQSSVRKPCEEVTATQVKVLDGESSKNEHIPVDDQVQLRWQPEVSATPESAITLATESPNTDDSKFNEDEIKSHLQLPISAKGIELESFEDLNITDDRVANLKLELHSVEYCLPLSDEFCAFVKNIDFEECVVEGRRQSIDDKVTTLPAEIVVFDDSKLELDQSSVRKPCEEVTATQVKVLDGESSKDEHIPVDDQVQLRWQPEVSATPESAITLTTESPNTDDSKFNEDEIKSHLQLPISAKGIELESFEDLNITDDRVANLKLELHSVEYCLPLSDEFCAFVKNIDFEECVVEGRRQSIDDKVTTLPAEIVVFDDSKLELDQSSVRKPCEEVTATQVKVLDGESSKDEHIPVDDQVQLRWQPEVSATPESAITLATESPNTDDSKFNEDEIKSHLQLPISAKGIELESFEDLNITDDRVANLKLELHSVEYCLPLRDEFCAFVKNIDFEECVVEGRRQSIDDKVTTLPAEIVVFDDSKLELDQSSVRKPCEEVTATQVKVLDGESSKDEHIPVDDQVQLRWQPEVSATPESAITLATESPNTDDSKFNEDEIKSHLQLPISAKGIELESFEDLNITDDRVANLKLELHSVEYCLPLSDEFCAFVKNIDFEECVVEGRRQSIDDKVTTLPAEIVVFDDSKLELDQSSVHRLFAEARLLLLVVL
ncbi:hypothetical protein Aperf_G00000087751 [Anoplocephala perfoliata]